MKLDLLILVLAAFILAPKPALSKEVQVGLVLDKGGKDDKSFNAGAVRGAVQAKEDFHIRVKYVEAIDDNAYVPMMRAFASRGYDLVIGIGTSQMEAVKKVSKDFPNTHFAIVDATVDGPNVRSLIFQDHEGSFLVGALAAMTSKTGKIGFIGGMDIPLIRRFEMGYKAGAKQINPKIKVTSNYVGITDEAWNNPAKGKELAIAQYGAGVDVIFGAAGASGSGMFDAAEERRKFAIGVDSNQNWVKPGYVLTSMLKHVDHAVYAACGDEAKGVFTPGVVHFGLNNDGVGYAMDEYNAKLVPDSALTRLEELKSQIISGKIQVPDYYKRR